MRKEGYCGMKKTIARVMSALMLVSLLSLSWGQTTEYSTHNDLAETVWNHE